MAGEIYIADKATLDQVKTNTDNILGNFPISGGTSFEDRNTNLLGYYHSGYPTNNLLLSINGSGLLYGIGIGQNSNQKQFKVTIDGGTPVYFFSTGSYGMIIMKKFNSSLKIETYEDYGYHYISYSLD